MPAAAAGHLLGATGFTTTTCLSAASWAERSEALSQGPAPERCNWDFLRLPPSLPRRGLPLGPQTRGRLSGQAPVRGPIRVPRRPVSEMGAAKEPDPLGLEGATARAACLRGWLSGRWAGGLSGAPWAEETLPRATPPAPCRLQTPSGASISQVCADALVMTEIQIHLKALLHS